jgi:hypothetical protein
LNSARQHEQQRRTAGSWFHLKSGLLTSDEGTQDVPPFFSRCDMTTTGDDTPLTFPKRTVYVVRPRYKTSAPEEGETHVPVSVPFISLQGCPCCGST